MSSRGRGRKRKIDTESGSLFKYLRREKENSNEIVKSVIKGLIETVFCKIDKRKHHAIISSKTLDLWKREFPWLVLTGEENDLVMKCQVCLEKKVASIWSQEGSRNIQKSSLSRHANSIEHITAEKSQLSSYAPKTVESGDDSSCKDTDIDSKLFRTVFYAAREGLPTNQVNNLLVLQRMNGADIKYKNLSWDTLSGIQSSIKSVLQKEIVTDILESDFFSVILDESTDLTVEKHLSICLRYTKHGESVTKFLTNISVQDGRAHTIVNQVIQALEKFELDPTKMVSLATDGAATMVGHKTGVGVQLKSKYSPFLIHTHCIAHRLNLAVTDSIKKSSDLVKFREKFNSLYIFMSGSSARVSRLKSIQKILNEPELTIKEPHGIRWLGLQNAVVAVYEGYGSVLATLSSFAAEKNAKAAGLLKYFSRYKTVLLVAFMLDVHEIIGKLSLSLQKDDINFSEIQPLIDGTVERLVTLESKDGIALKDMKNSVQIKHEDDNISASLQGEPLTYYAKEVDSQFDTVRENYLSSLQKNIKHRFRKQAGDIFRDLSALLEPDVMNSTEDQEIESALESIATLYGEEKETTFHNGEREEKTQVPPLLDRGKLETEWPMLKGMLKGAYRKRSTKSVCKRVLTVHVNDMPEISKLCKIALSVSVTSVVCERSFSYQNRLKTKYRSSLKEESLDNILQIQMCDQDFTTYNPTQAIKYWDKVKKRRKKRLFQEYKPRVATSDKTKTC